METQKLIKLIFIIFLVWLVVTYIPNSLLRKWWFVLFIFADFFLVAKRVQRRFASDLFLNTTIIGLLILGFASVILNRLGF